MTDQPEVNMFNPKWHRAYDRFTGRGGFNQAHMRVEFDSAIDQIIGLTEELSRKDQELHEIRSRLDAIENDSKIVSNTSPTERKPKAGSKAPA